MADRELTLPSRAARLRGAARGLGLADFWQWWRGQLDPLLPQAARTAVARRRMRPVLVFAGGQAALWQPAVEAGVPVMRAAATIPVSADASAHAAEGRAALAGSGRDAGVRRVVVSLAPADLLRKRLVLPAALEENLRQALAYDLDRHTPFKPEELYFDAVVVDRAPARGTITVDLATARRSAVDPVLRHVAAWGAEVVAVVPEPPATAWRSRLNLLPADARTARPLLRRWQFWLPLLAILAALAAVIVIPLWQMREQAISLGQQADEARGRAAVSETLRAQVNQQVGDYNFALERKYAFPSALAVVDTVSRLLPDDTWLTQFELKSTPKGKDVQREINLRGETANAGKLVQLFEESQMFAQAAQRGPTTKIQPGPGEIFDLGAQLRQRPAPAPVTVAVNEASTQPAGGAPAPAAPVPAARPSVTPVPAATVPAVPVSSLPGSAAPASGATASVPAAPVPAAPVPAASGPVSAAPAGTAKGTPPAPPGPAGAPTPSGAPGGASAPGKAVTPPAPSSAPPDAASNAVPASPGGMPPGGTIRREARP